MNVRVSQVRNLQQELVKVAIQPASSELMTQSQSSEKEVQDRLVFERVLPEHTDFATIKAIFKLSHAKILSIYKKHDPQTRLLEDSIDDLQIGWLGCTRDMQTITQAFEELKTEGLKVCRSLDQIIEWVIRDKATLREENEQKGILEAPLKKMQWRSVICLTSEQFKGVQGERIMQSNQSVYRLVHPCYIVDYAFKV